MATQLPSSTKSSPPNSDTQTDIARSTLGDLQPDQVSDLKLQRSVGRVFLFPLGLLIIFMMRVVYGYRVKELPKIRAQFLDIVAKNPNLVVCPNHLTMIDSVILLWAFASLPRYFVNYRLFSWNIPAFENFATRISWRIVTYLSKCIPIVRTGSSDHIDSVLGKIRYLLGSGELCTIFPEGTRSRTGRIVAENVTYGIGKILREVPGCNVLCVYLRGAGQETYSQFPKKGENFTIKMELLSPASKNEGLRAVRDYSVQIISKLKEMEDSYFAENGSSFNRQ